MEEDLHDRRDSPVYSRMVSTAIALSALAAAGLLVSRILQLNDWQSPMTLAASTGYVLIALLGGARRSPYGSLVLGALVCCWLGDWIGPEDFLHGAYAFVAAHLLLIIAFLGDRFSWRSAWPITLLLVVAGMAVVGLLWPYIPTGERAFVVGYTVVISLMVTTAFGSRAENRLIPLAALTFYVSDLFVARWRYIGGDINGLLCYPLYYLACIQFASSVSVRTRQTERTTHQDPADTPPKSQRNTH